MFIWFILLGKNKMEMFGGLVKSFSTTTDEYYLSATVKDVNDFFDQEMSFLQTYHQNLKEATARADRQTGKHKDVADSYIKISTNLLQLATTDNGKLERFLTKIADMFEKLRVRFIFTTNSFNVSIHLIPIFVILHCIESRRTSSI